MIHEFQAAFHLANRKEPRRAVEKERLLQAKEVIEQRVDCFRQGHLPLGKSRVYQVYYLTNADQESPDCLFKSPFLGEAEIKLS